jgi:2-amino-4-hydroxy-6-hydroxymethyldihydropteridine diphosphokinase
MQTGKEAFQMFAFISLGANISSVFGHPEDTLKYAIEELSKFSDQALLVSSFWKSAPLDCPPDSEDFVNAVVGIIPTETETAFSFLKKLQELENKCGRKRSGLENEARTLDLDIINFRNIRCDNKKLVLPHPRAHSRKFVLQPLMEIAKDLILPGQSKTLAELISSVQQQVIKKMN